MHPEIGGEITRDPNTGQIVRREVYFRREETNLNIKFVQVDNGDWNVSVNYLEFEMKDLDLIRQLAGDNRATRGVIYNQQDYAIRYTETDSHLWVEDDMTCQVYVNEPIRHYDWRLFLDTLYQTATEL